MRSLRWRIIGGAMAAFAILLVLLLALSAAAGYARIERSADEIIDRLNSDQPPHRVSIPPSHFFGYRLDMRRNEPAWCIVTFNESGEQVDRDSSRLFDEDETILDGYIEAALFAGNGEGKVGSWKYRFFHGDGETRLILLDNSAQLRSLLLALEVAAALSAVSLAALFLILLPVSARVVRSHSEYLEKQKRFITDAGHEIKTPVAIITSNLDAMELLQGENKWSRNIRAQSERLGELIARLLAMARMDERAVAAKREPLALDALVQQELDAYDELLQTHQLTVNASLDEGATLRGDRESLVQLLHILLDNAAQYAQSGTVLAVRLQRKSTRLFLEMINSVEALPPLSPDALFDRFTRGDLARTQGASSAAGHYGVGLSAARAIAELHRGRLTAAYPDAHHVRFVAELPRR